MFSTRLEPHVMAALKEGAKTFPGKSVSAFTEYLIDRGLRAREEEERDPALQALLFLIAHLAGEISGAKYESDPKRRAEMGPEWRTDSFNFRAFKVAVGKLLDALEEPATHWERGEFQLRDEPALKGKSEEWGITQEDLAQLEEARKSPEAYAAFEFELLWDLAQQRKLPPLNKEEFELGLRYPPFRKVFESLIYKLPRAHEALKLKPETTNPEEKSK